MMDPIENLPNRQCDQAQDFVAARRHDDICRQGVSSSAARTAGGEMHKQMDKLGESCGAAEMMNETFR